MGTQIAHLNAKKVQLLNLKELCRDIRAACYYFKNIWNEPQNVMHVDIMRVQAQAISWQCAT